MRGHYCAGRVVRIKHTHNPQKKWKNMLIVTIAIDEGGAKLDLCSLAAWEDKALKYKELLNINDYVFISYRRYRGYSGHDNNTIKGIKFIDAPEDQPPIDEKLIAALDKSGEKKPKPEVKETVTQEDLEELDDNFL
jgi:hypothetical protein